MSFSSDLNLYRRILHQTRRYRLPLATIFLLDLLSAPLLLLTPIPLKIAVDNVIGGHPLPRGFLIFVPAFIADSVVWLLMLAAVLQVTLSLLGQLKEMWSYVL